MPDFFIYKLNDDIYFPIFFWVLLLLILFFHLKFVKVPEQKVVKHLVKELNKINKMNKAIDNKIEHIISKL